jgi:hypothetical protein
MFRCLSAGLRVLAVTSILADPGVAQQLLFDSDSRTRGLSFGWGHSWSAGLPGYGKTQSDIQSVAFHPQMGWFMTRRLELYGEGTLLVHVQPAAISGGLAGLAGRYHFWNDRNWTPYVSAGAGLLWTSLEVEEIDRVFNFQLLFGIGVRIFPEKRGPSWIFEFRNFHISNAGTAGENLGVNSATILAGVAWILR